MAYIGEGGTVTYGMIGHGSHWCSNIGRAHKSNHVYFMVDFATGGFCQKCYDPDCAGEWCQVRLRWGWGVLAHAMAGYASPRHGQALA